MTLPIGTLNQQNLHNWCKSLPFRVGVLHAIVAAALLFASLWIIYEVLEQERHDQELNLNLSQGKLILAKLQLMIAELDTLAVAIADVAANHNHDVQTLKLTLPSLLSLPKQQHLIASGGVWPEPDFPFGADELKTSLFWVRNDLGKLELNNSYNDTLGYQDEDWYKPVRLFPSGRVYWSPSYIDPYTKESMVSAAAPIWKNDHYQGTATIDVSLTSLTKFTDAAGNELHGYILLFDQYNRILAAPSLAKTNNPSLDSTPAKVADISALIEFSNQFTKLQSLLEQADTDFIRKSIQSSAIAEEHIPVKPSESYLNHNDMYRALINQSIQGNPKAAVLLGTIETAIDPFLQQDSLTSVYLMPGTYWKVVTVTPKISLKHEAMLLAERAWLYVLLAQLVALTLLYLIQKNQFIQPIARIIRALKSNNSALLELDANRRNDEIGVLTKAFLERTEQLEIAKASLDASNLALEQQLAVQAENQQELLNHKEHLFALLKSSPNLIYIKDLKGRYLLVNDKYCETIGLERQRILGATDQQLFSSDIAANYGNSDRRAMAQDAPLLVEDTLPALTGEQQYQFIKFTVRDDEDNLKGIGAIAFDIKNRKNAEDELKAQIQTLESTLVRMRQLKEHQELKEQQLEQALAKQIELGLEESAKDRAWQTERQLLNAWQHSWLDSLMQEHDRLVSLACQSAEEDLESIRASLMLCSNRLRLAENLIGKHRRNHIANPISVLQDLKNLFDPELKRRGSIIQIEGDEKCGVSVEVWQLTLLFFQLIRKITKLEVQNAQITYLHITVKKSDTNCLITFNRKGVNADLIEGDVSQLCNWLQQQGDAYLSLEAAKDTFILNCYLPLAC